jgi:hypothetical protein
LLTALSFSFMLLLYFVYCRCDECTLCYHYECLDPPLTKSPKRRGYSWHCAACDPIGRASDYASNITRYTDKTTGRCRVLPIGLRWLGLLISNIYLSGLSNFASPQLVVLATLVLRKWRQLGEQRAATPNLLMKINTTQQLAFIMEVLRLR